MKEEEEVLGVFFAADRQKKRFISQSFSLRFLYFFFLLLPQVILSSAGERGFLDASECGTWLKFIRSGDDPRKGNLKPVMFSGQVISYTSCTNA